VDERDRGRVTGGQIGRAGAIGGPGDLSRRGRPRGRRCTSPPPRTTAPIPLDLAMSALYAIRVAGD
jgi:hypothetical protein